MSFKYDNLEFAKLSPKEYTMYLIKQFSELNMPYFIITDRDLYRANIGLKKFIKMFEKETFIKVKCWVRSDEYGFWQVFIYNG